MEVGGCSAGSPLALRDVDLIAPHKVCSWERLIQRQRYFYNISDGVCLPAPRPRDAGRIFLLPKGSFGKLLFHIPNGEEERAEAGEGQHRDPYSATRCFPSPAFSPFSLPPAALCYTPPACQHRQARRGKDPRRQDKCLACSGPGSSLCSRQDAALDSGQQGSGWALPLGSWGTSGKFPKPLCVLVDLMTRRRDLNLDPT